MSKFRKEFSQANPTLTQAITDVAIIGSGMMKLLSAGAVMSTGLIGFPELSYAAETPVLGGRLRAALANAPASDTLDPAKGSNRGNSCRLVKFDRRLTEPD